MTEFGANNVNNFVLPVCVWGVQQPRLVARVTRELTWFSPGRVMMVTGVGSECLCQSWRSQCPSAETLVSIKVSWSQRWSLACSRSSGPSTKTDTEVGWLNIFWHPSVCVYISIFFYPCQSAAQSCIPWCSYAGCTEDNLWSIVEMGHPQNCPATNKNFSRCLRK